MKISYLAKNGLKIECKNTFVTQESNLIYQEISAWGNTNIKSSNIKKSIASLLEQSEQKQLGKHPYLPDEKRTNTIK